VKELVARHPVLVVSAIKVAVLMLVLITALAYVVWFERKVVAHIQSRWGPYRVGPHGLLQPLADGLKFLFKEDLTPAGADRIVYFLAPFLSMSLALTAIAVIPFGPGEIEILGQRTSLAVADLNIGLLFLFAITSMGVYGVALAGWSSNSKYPLLGSLRSAAQMVSYELALTMSVIGVLLLAGTLNLREIVAGQQGHWLGLLPRWYIWPQLLGFFCFFVAAVAETNRLPFDLPEAESELVAGFHTEYASFKFAMFFLAEYASMITVSCVATLLFFGGWLSPFPDGALFGWPLYLPAAVLLAGAILLVIDGGRYPTRFGKLVLPLLGVALGVAAWVCAVPGVVPLVQGPFWFLGKVFVFLFIYVWVRGTLPRFRYDQLMAIGWKLLLPLSLANAVLTSLAVVVAGR
jgi:NADH-quinone oxidoreductase subunit H